MNKSFTTRQYFSQLYTIYFAQVGVMLIFSGVLFAIAYSGSMVIEQDAAFAQTLTYALTTTVIAGFTAAHFLYHFQLSKVDASLPLQKKMPKFIGIVLIRSACMELPALLASIAYFLTGNVYLLAIPVLTAVVFFLLRPTPDSIAEDLKLTAEEHRLLKDPAAIIAMRD
jgi:hypothetical protein